MGVIKTVVITRPEGGGPASLAAKVAALGVNPLILPVMRCNPLALSVEDEALVRSCITKGGGWIAFLSPNAVHVFKRLIANRLPGIDLSPSLRCAAQGHGTAEALYRAFGRRADFIPSVFVAEEFGEEFTRVVSPPERVLIPQSADGRDVLAPLLRARGFEVVSVRTYRMCEGVLSPEKIAEVELLDTSATVLVFMSPSAVRATVKALGRQREFLAQVPILSVGPITTQAVRMAGLQVAIEAVAHSERGVIEALERELQR